MNATRWLLVAMGFVVLRALLVVWLATAHLKVMIATPDSVYRDSTDYFPELWVCTAVAAVLSVIVRVQDWRRKSV